MDKLSSSDLFDSYRKEAAADRRVLKKRKVAIGWGPTMEEAVGNFQQDVEAKVAEVTGLPASTPLLTCPYCEADYPAGTTSKNCLACGGPLPGGGKKIRKERVVEAEPSAGSGNPEQINKQQPLTAWHIIKTGLQVFFFIWIIIPLFLITGIIWWPGSRR